MPASSWRLVQTLADLTTNTDLERTVRIPVVAGHHTLSLRYGHANLYPTELAAADPRPLTGAVRSLVLPADSMPE